MKQNIVGREKEIQILEGVMKSKEAEFVALYGRRRVGKTFLVREFFSSEEIYLEVTGIKDGSLKDQLEIFTKSFSSLFYGSAALQPPKNWKDAFALLTEKIEQHQKKGKVIIFLDELPWLSTKRSDLLQALDYYWNRIWSRQKNLILIVCGSAASWMLDHLINAKGGLHNRITKTLLLNPYNLRGTKAFLRHHGINLNDKQVLDLYMAFGGIPHYLKQVSKGMSAAQIINTVCFQKDGLLYGEFDRLFASLFNHAEEHLILVRLIGKNRYGLSREEIIRTTTFASGGTLNKRLQELEAAGFIQKFVPYGKKKKDHYYRLIDEYIHFYLYWIEPLKEKGIEGGKSYWQSKLKSPQVMAWAGYTFENICLKHVDPIKYTLGLDSIPCEVGSWRYIPKKKSSEQGAQIDLLFDREDGILNICEIKYSEHPFTMTKLDAANLLNKVTSLEKHLPTRKQVFITLITTTGWKKNIWSEDLIHNEVGLNHLYRL